VDGDPLSFFVREKVADEVAAGASAAPNPPGKTLDPGEKALAGLAAQSSIYAVGGALVGGEVLRHFAGKDSVPWGDVDPILGATSIQDLPQMVPKNEARFLGLFDVAGRPKTAPPHEFQGVVHKLDEIHGVVDSFFDKHRLGEKGVTLNFRSGLFTSIRGTHYDVGTKRVFLPQVSKEIALHELGHAADYTGSTLGKLRAIAEPVFRSAALASVPIALIAGDELAKAIPGTVDDRAIQFLQDHAPAVMGATLAATTLYPEAKASVLALQHIGKMEGRAAVGASLKKLLPLWGSYLLHAIPPVVGMALARKYMREARARNEKTAGVVGAALGGLKNTAADLGYVARQLGQGVVELVKDPEVGRRIAGAAREVGTSPDFVLGALTAAIPATAGALYLYGTEPGRVIRQQINRAGRSTKEVFGTRPHDELWRESHPAAFAGLVGLGAALSRGVIIRMVNDLTQVL
jgi:hypothetical protein